MQVPTPQGPKPLVPTTDSVTTTVIRDLSSSDGGYTPPGPPQTVEEAIERAKAAMTRYPYPPGSIELSMELDITKPLAEELLAMLIEEDILTPGGHDYTRKGRQELAERRARAGGGGLRYDAPPPADPPVRPGDPT